MSTGGKITIPKTIREELNLKPGAKLTVELLHGEIVLHPVWNEEELHETLQFLRDMVADGPSLTEALEADRRWELKKERRRAEMFFNKNSEI